MKSICYVQGHPDAEHLRAEVEGDSITLISHELRVGPVQNVWYDRVLVSMRLAQWQVVGRVIANRQRDGH